MESYQNKFANIIIEPNVQNMTLNLYANYIYSSKRCSLLKEIPEIKYKKLKQKTNQNIFDRNEKDNKIPYKIKDNIYNK